MKRIQIVAGIILSADKQRIFITKRADNAHQGGLWEFPGGKVEAQESHLAALKRELFEEVGIHARTVSPFHHLAFHYPDKQLHLEFFLVEAFDGSPIGKEHQQGRWVAVNELNNYPFPPANDDLLQQIVHQLG